MRFDVTKPNDYDILCALRGPDDANESTAAYYAKRLCTASIRWLCGMTPYQNGAYIQSPSAVLQLFKDHNTDFGLAYDFLAENTHYRNHICMACSALKHKLRGKPEKLAELKLLTDLLQKNVPNFQ